MGVIERPSSSSPRTDKQNPSFQKDGHGLFREKIIRKVSSFSSASPSRKKEEEEKDKENKQCVKEGKLIRRASSFSSSLEKEKESPDLQKVKVIRRVSSLSSSSLKKKESQDLQKVKHIRRVSSLSSSSPKKESQDLQKVKVTRRVSSLSSSSPKKKDSSHDLQKVKLVRRVSSLSSSSSIKKENPISNQKGSSLFKSRLRESGPICKRRKETLAEVSVKFQLEENDDDVNISLDKKIEEEGKENFWLSSGIMSPQDFGFFMSSLDPSLDELVLVKEPISSFWNTDRTGVWVSLINLNGEDSKWISEDLESNFPCPNCDSYSSDIGFTTSSHSEWSSSDLLSDSMDWELDSEDPIFWPFGKDFDWDDKKWDSFSVSPRKGLRKINFEQPIEGDSVKLRFRSRKHDSKEALKRKILFVSGLSASKIIEFKKGRNSKISKRGGRFKRRGVPPILENILEEGKSPKESPKNDEHSSSDMLSETTDSDGPIFWPSDQKCDWDSTWDFFNVSPRKQTVSPKGGFSISSSVRLKFRPKKKKPKTLCASKSFKFKTHKSSNKPNKRVLVIIPSKMEHGINKPAEFKPGSSRKRMREMPLRSVEEIMRMVSVMAKNRKFYEDESNLEELPIEIAMGLGEFDGHEGVDPEFEGDSFSLNECMED